MLYELRSITTLFIPVNTVKIVTLVLTLINSFLSAFPITEDCLGYKHIEVEIAIFNRSDLYELE